MTWTIRPRSKVGGLAAIMVGAGPATVLIHGVGLRAEAWGAQIDALARSCRVTAIDLPGHGSSRALDPGPGLADYTDAIAASMAEPSVVIGHSFGAMIALDMAIRHPGKVRAVAALNAVHRRGAAARAAVMSRAASLDGVSAADPAATLDRWFGPTPSPEREACRICLCAVDARGYRDAYRVFAAEDGPFEQDLAALACPALFVTGSDEPNSTPAMTERMAELAPHGWSEIVPGAAHMMPMTHASEVNARLDPFIKAHGK